MNTIYSLMDRALLSEAAYANFVDNSGNLFTNISDIEAALRGPANDRLFSDAQAADFVTHWKVVDHIPDTDSGFSASVFERIDGPDKGKRYFAVRGTLGWSDMVTDFAYVGADGIAINQGIDMYNWYQRLISPAGTVTQYRYHKEETNALNQVTKPAWIETFTITTSRDGSLYGGSKPGGERGRSCLIA